LSPRSPSLLDWDRRRRENDDGDGLLCSDRRHFDGSALSPSPDTPFPDFLNLRRSCALRILVFRPNPLLVPTGNPSQSPLSTHRGGFDSGSFSFAVSLALSPHRERSTGFQPPNQRAFPFLGDCPPQSVPSKVVNAQIFIMERMSRMDIGRTIDGRAIAHEMKRDDLWEHRRFFSFVLWGH